jgi:hypothetical protein
MKVVLKRARLSFPRLDKPEAFEGGEPKYKATLVVTDPADVKALKSAVMAVGQEEFRDKFAAGIRSQKLRNPIKKSDDDEASRYPAGSIYIRTATEDQPGMVAVWRGPDGKAARVTADQFYAGCFVNASVWCFAYDHQMNKGVSFALNNIQFVADGERLDNRIAAEDEFEVDEDAEAPLEDLDEDEDEDAGGDLDEDEDKAPAPTPAPKKRKTRKAAAAAAPTETELDDLL